MKKRMNAFQEQMNEKAQEFQRQAAPQQQPQPASKGGDYIDFEEVK